MSPQMAEIQQIKRRVSPRVLRIPGVSGVGIPSGKLTVYVERDTPDVRRAVEKVFNTHAPGVGHAYATTGSFKALSG